MKTIDLRSDTVTVPTQEMRQAMFDAVVGDDVYGDDVTVNRLEALAASITGKEDALFVPTGTMGNQIAIMTHTQRGDEMIAGNHSHVVYYEAGAPAILSGVNYALVHHPLDYVEGSDITKLMRADDIHFPRTSLVCLENPLTNGMVVPLEVMADAYTTAKSLGLQVHLDGARLFNASTFLNVDPKEITQFCDSVMFCISKGLCAPIGSLLCGSKAFIHKARRNRKILGGGMRQAGVLAACGIISLEKMVQELKSDHDLAQYLGHRLNEIPHVSVDMNRVQINMVFLTIDKPGFETDDFVVYMNEKGVKITSIRFGYFRFVTNHHVSKDDIDYVLHLIREYLD